MTHSEKPPFTDDELMRTLQPVGDLGVIPLALAHPSLAQFEEVALPIKARRVLKIDSSLSPPLEEIPETHQIVEGLGVKHYGIMWPVARDFYGTFPKDETMPSLGVINVRSKSVSGGILGFSGPAIQAGILFTPEGYAVVRIRTKGKTPRGGEKLWAIRELNRQLRLHGLRFENASSAEGKGDLIAKVVKISPEDYMAK